MSRPATWVLWLTAERPDQGRRRCLGRDAPLASDATRRSALGTMKTLSEVSNAHTAGVCRGPLLSIIAYRWWPRVASRGLGRCAAG
jgi:hypothetical protein